MSKTLKTYPDGSELTTTGLAGIVAVGCVTAAVGAVAAVKWDNFKTNRWYKKHPEQDATRKNN